MKKNNFVFFWIIVVNKLKFIIQIEKMGKDLSKYSKIEDKIAATLIFAATLIIAPTVNSYRYEKIIFRHNFKF
jgi:hypothetical protein